MWDMTMLHILKYKTTCIRNYSNDNTPPIECCGTGKQLHHKKGHVKMDGCMVGVCAKYKSAQGRSEGHNITKRLIARKRRSWGWGGMNR